MLSERARRLKDDIAAIEARAESLGRVQALVTAAEKLKSAQRELAMLREWENAFVARKVIVTYHGSAKKNAIEAVKGYRDKLPTSASAEPAVIGQLVNQLRAAANEQRAGLTIAWTSYVQSRAPALNTAVLSVLRSIPSLKSPATLLERSLRAIDDWRSALPEHASAADAFDDAVLQATSIWRQLGGEDIGAEVAKFLQDAATSTATIESLTPEIRDWLTKHHIWHAFRITLVSDASASRSWR